MRHSSERGTAVRNTTVELSLAEHQALKNHAQREGKTIGKVLREALMPIIASEWGKPRLPGPQE